LIQANDGDYYGNTSAGGAYGTGLIFRLKPNGDINLLYSFASVAFDGSAPSAGLLQASDGNFYGTTVGGGGGGDGVIFQLTPKLAYSILLNFTIARGANPQVPLVQHSNGIIYGETNYGGSGNHGTVYSLNLQLPVFVHLPATAGRVGSSVEILGQGFTSATAVSFGGKAAQVTARSGTYLRATVPSGALTGIVRVRSGSTMLTGDHQFRVLPSVNDFSPKSGRANDIVVIKGSGLTEVLQVTFGGVSAASVTVDSDSAISAQVPMGAKAGKIVIVSRGGSAASSATFTVTK
jgi:uncharacterized repeat protein (TIGR03803 family)